MPETREQRKARRRQLRGDDPLPEAVVPPEDAQQTAKALMAWVDEADDSERQARAEAAQVVNAHRKPPWKSVTAHLESVLDALSG